MDAYEIEPEAAHRLLEAGAAALIDVREQAEWERAHIAGAELIPLSLLPQSVGRLQQLAATRPLVVVCHHGVRSLHAVVWLREQGVANCVSLAGGIEAWSRRVDAGVPRY